MPFINPETLALVDEVARLLVEKNATIAVSEAACGGILLAYLVSKPGASAFFQGGTLVYSLKSKLKLLGWSEREILSYTGPSEASVLKQARNLRVELGSTYVLCESGFAGGGEIEGHGAEDRIDDSGKVGTVFFAISGPEGERSVVRNTGLKERVDNMERFAQMGLRFLLEELKGDSLQ